MQRFFDDVKEEFELLSESDKLILQEIVKVLKDPFYEGNKAYFVEKMMRGYDIGSDNKRKIVGEPTEIIRSENKNVNVDMDRTDDIEESLEDMDEDGILDWLG